MKSSRRGSIYLVVLAASALVVTMALVGLELSRRDMFTATSTRDSINARLAAESGIDHAIAYMQQGTWRSQVGSGQIARNIPLGSAQYSVTIADDTGDITASSLDMLRITSIGQAGNSRVSLEASAQPTAIVSEHLNYVLCAQTNINFNTGSNLSGTGTIRAGGTATAVLSTILQRVEAGVLPLGLTYNGGIGVSSSSLSTIDMTSVINYYKSIGTAVPYASLTSGRIEQQVVSQDVTPWGVTNSKGVYIIDCKGNNVRIRDSRIIATLVFINATAGVDLDHPINWVVGTSTYPAAICDGTMNMGMDSVTLNESTFSVNFNPAGAAGTDRVGTTDTDKLDTYQSRIYGVVYAKTLTLSNKQRIQGAAISQSSITCSGTLGLVYDSTAYSSPPPGFTTPGSMYIVENSWKRVAN